MASMKSPNVSQFQGMTSERCSGKSSTQQKVASIASRCSGRRGASVSPQFPASTVVTPCQMDGVQSLSRRVERRNGYEVNETRGHKQSVSINVVVAAAPRSAPDRRQSSILDTQVSEDSARSRERSYDQTASDDEVVGQTSSPTAVYTMDEKQTAGRRG